MFKICFKFCLRFRVGEVNYRIEYFIKPQQYLESARRDLQNDVKIQEK